MSTLSLRSLLATVVLLTACMPTKRHGWPVQAGPHGGDPHASAPQPGLEPAFFAPVPVEQVLDNGLRVLVVSKRNLPLVHIRVLLRGGSALDPPSVPGLAMFYGETLRAGTDEMGSEALADAFESLGASLHVEVGTESIELSATTLREHADRLVELLGAVLLRPAFAVDELERVRKRLIISLQQERDEPTALADRLFWQTVYAEHPYGHAVSGSASALTKITREDLLAYGGRVAQAKNATLVLVGDVDEPHASQMARGAFGTWTPGEQVADVALPTAAPARIVIIDQPSAPQSQLRIGALGVARSSPDRDALLLCNAVLGGQFNSRINMNLREDKGYTYGAFSRFAFMRRPGPFVVSTGVRTDASAPAIDEILREVATMRETSVTQEELNNARNLYVLSLPSAFQTIAGMASSVAQLSLYDLPLDYFRTLPARLAAITTADVLRVAAQHLSLEALSIVVVGDRTKIEKGLEQLRRGAPELVTPEQVGL